jgi:hypothetical protein
MTPLQTSVQPSESMDAGFANTLYLPNSSTFRLRLPAKNRAFSLDKVMLAFLSPQRLNIRMLTSWAEIIAALCTFQLGWLIYGVAYRLFLSSLAKLPGPKLPALTSWYEFNFDVIKPGKFVWKTRDLHKQYGVHFVPRIKPSFLTLNFRTYHPSHVSESARR